MPEAEEMMTVAAARALPNGATGWNLKTARDVTQTEAPTAAELATLRDLHERTTRAHAPRR